MEIIKDLLDFGVVVFICTECGIKFSASRKDKGFVVKKDSSFHYRPTGCFGLREETTERRVWVFSFNCPQCNEVVENKIPIEGEPVRVSTGWLDGDV